MNYIHLHETPTNMGVAVEYSLEAGRPQQHQMSKSWRAFTYTIYNTYRQRHIFRLSHKDVTLMNITIINNSDSRMPTTSSVSGRPEGSHVAFVRW